MAIEREFPDNTEGIDELRGNKEIILRYKADASEVTAAVDEIVSQLARLQKAFDDFYNGIKLVEEPKDANS